MKIRLTHIDGKLPNLALMKLSHWYKSEGNSLYFTKDITRSLFESDYDIVYASSIFMFSNKRLQKFLSQFPGAIIGGTGSGNTVTVEQIIGQEYDKYDYSIYPDYRYSLGFTARGCRLRCKFCVVPNKEGKPRPINTIYDIWRVDTPKNIMLLDNDFFGQPREQWIERINEIIKGDFKISFIQGINIRLITDEAAFYLSKIPYYDDQFKTRRLYTAWDNLKDEKIFFDGVNKLQNAGIPPSHLMVYMLIGFEPSETWERIFYRFNKMVEMGIRPYPMVYNNKNKKLKQFQRWVIRRYYELIPWEQFNRNPNRETRNIDELPLFGGY